MAIEIATATEMQNNFGRYLNLVMSGNEVIVTKNGREVRPFYSERYGNILSDRLPYRNIKRRV